MYFMVLVVYLSLGKKAEGPATVYEKTRAIIFGLKASDFLQMQKLPDCDALKEDKSLASSTDMLGWSPSQKRRSWKHLHSMIAGHVPGQCPSDWLDFIKNFRYIKNGSSEGSDRRIPDGTFQGFTVFSDTASHAAMWRMVLDKLAASGSMDDVLSLDVSKTSELTTAEIT